MATIFQRLPTKVGGETLTPLLDRIDALGDDADRYGDRFSAECRVVYAAHVHREAALAPRRDRRAMRIDSNHAQAGERVESPGKVEVRAAVFSRSHGEAAPARGPGRPR